MDSNSKQAGMRDSGIFLTFRQQKREALRNCSIFQILQTAKTSGNTRLLQFFRGLYSKIKRDSLVLRHDTFEASGIGTPCILQHFWSSRVKDPACFFSPEKMENTRKHLEYQTNYSPLPTRFLHLEHFLVKEASGNTRLLYFPNF